MHLLRPLKLRYDEKDVFFSQPFPLIHRRQREIQNQRRVAISLGSCIVQAISEGKNNASVKTMK